MSSRMWGAELTLSERRSEVHSDCTFAGLRLGVDARIVPMWGTQVQPLTPTSTCENGQKSKLRCGALDLAKTLVDDTYGCEVQSKKSKKV